MPVTLSGDGATPVTLLSDGVTSASHFGEGETNKGLPFRIGCAVARFKRGATYQETSKISSSHTWFRRNRYHNKHLLLQAWIAQLVVHWLGTRKVQGSNPDKGKKFSMKI